MPHFKVNATQIEHENIIGAVVGRMTFIFRSIYFSLSVSSLDLFPIFDVGSVAGEEENGVQTVINLYYVLPKCNPFQ